MEQKLHFLIFHRHNAGVGNIFPDLLRIGQIIHADQGAVQCPHAGACNAFDLHARFPHGFPCADLVCTLCAAALQNKTIFLCKVNYRFHD